MNLQHVFMFLAAVFGIATTASVFTWWSAGSGRKFWPALSTALLSLAFLVCGSIAAGMS